MCVTIQTDNHSNSRGLREFFPTLRSRQEVLRDINSNPVLLQKFQDLSPNHQEEFLNFCTGSRGVKILYDIFFKRVFNIEDGKENLMHLLSVLLGREVEEIEQLSLASGIAADSSLVIMDIVVRLSDRSIVNVEVQKYGYKFPAQRAACYSADLVMRQYTSLKQEAQKTAMLTGRKVGDLIDYKDIMPVYTFVLIERSTAEFWKHPDRYVHSFRAVSDTGLKLDLLQRYVFIPLDIFLPILHDRGITSELDAWITFLASDAPEDILRVLEYNPDIFRPIYDKIYRICQDTEEALNMFSEALAILDRNTVLNMIEDDKETIRKTEEALRKAEEDLRRAEEARQKSEEARQQDQERIRQLEAEIARISSQN